MGGARKNMNIDKKKIREIYKRRSVIIAAFIIFIVVIFAIIISNSNRSKKNKEIASGVKYLEDQEKGDPLEVDKVLKQQEEMKTQAQKEAMMKKLTDGKTDVWSLFGTSVVMGDSRAVGFSYFGFLPQERVFADSGDTIESITKYEDAVIKINPTYVFLCYGMNDVPYFKSADEYAAKYEALLKEFQGKLPNTKFYVSSILPVKDAAVAANSSLSGISDYTNAVKTMCEKDGFGYIDCTDVVKDHSELYEVDAIHFKRDFYQYWAAAMMINVYQDAGNMSDISSATDTSAK